MAPTARPEEVVVRVRRYLCRCGATITVTPSETQSRRLYTASAVGAALALFGVERLGASAVRAATSTWQVVGAAAVTGWATLRRWIAAVRAGRLFGGSVRAAPPDFAVRQVAERAAMTLAALGPPSQDEAGVVERAFRGAALAS